MNKQLKGSVLLLLATVIWGSAFIFQSTGMDHIGPFTFQTARCFLAVIGLLPVVLIADCLKGNGTRYFQLWADPKLWKAGLLCGLPLFLACNLQQVGLVDTDPGKSGFLTAMYIVIVPVFGIFLKRKTTIMVPISVVLAVAGLYCISCVGVTRISTGDLLTIACAFMFAVQIIFVDSFAHSVDALRLNTIQALVCGTLSAIIMIFTEQPTWTGIGKCALPLAYTGLLSMGVAYALQIIGQKHVEPTAASLIMSLEAVFALLFGVVFMHEELALWKCVGCVLMFAAIILSQLPVPKKSKECGKQNLLDHQTGR